MPLFRSLRLRTGLGQETFTENSAALTKLLSSGQEMPHENLWLDGHTVLVLHPS